jgi:hypothetical protein
MSKRIVSKEGAISFFIAYKCKSQAGLDIIGLTKLPEGVRFARNGTEPGSRTAANRAGPGWPVFGRESLAQGKLGLRSRAKRDLQACAGTFIKMVSSMTGKLIVC